MRITFELNGQRKTVDMDPETPLLWVLREDLEQPGTKFGCGRALCGACTIHVDGEAVRSCSFPVRYAEGKRIRTIEGLDLDALGRAVTEAWIELDVAQCGWCQPGQCMSAAALLSSNRNPDDAAIDASMSGNLCRCGTYPRIRSAVKAAARKLAQGGGR